VRISDAQSQLTAAWVEWKAHLINPRFVRTGNYISWTDASDWRLESEMTGVMVRDLVRRGQYSFLAAEDHSPIQMYYKFNPAGDTLLEARLAYCHNPYTSLHNLGTSAEAEEEIAEDPVSEEEMSVLASEEDEPSAAWIRFDNDHRLSERSVVHAACHLQLSHLPDTRIAVVGVPTPMQFIETIFQWFYPNIYTSLHLSEERIVALPARLSRINHIHAICEVNPIHETVLHMRIPQRR